MNNCTPNEQLDYPEIQGLEVKKLLCCFLSLKAYSFVLIKGAAENY